MSKDELMKLRKTLEEGLKYCPIIRNDCMYRKDEYEARVYINGFDEDKTERLIYRLEECLKEQVSRMVGTPYEYELEVNFDFGPICNEKFSTEYAGFDIFKDAQKINAYNASLLSQCIPGKLAMKVGNICTRCYLDGKAVPLDAIDRVNFPADEVCVVDFNNLLTKLKESGYELTIYDSDNRTNEPATDFEKIIKIFAGDCTKHVKVSVDFRKEKEIAHSPKTYTNSPSTKKAEDNQ